MEDRRCHVLHPVCQPGISDPRGPREPSECSLLGWAGAGVTHEAIVPWGAAILIYRPERSPSATSSERRSRSCLWHPPHLLQMGWACGAACLSASSPVSLLPSERGSGPPPSMCGHQQPHSHTCGTTRPSVADLGCCHLLQTLPPWPHSVAFALGLRRLPSLSS